MSGGRTDVLDLRGVGCPLNYVKVRVALDQVDPGQIVEVWVDRGEPEENVPRSAEEDGYVIEALETVADGSGPFVRVRIRR